MKTFDRLLAMPILKYFFFAMLLLIFSCSDDDTVEVPEEETEIPEEIPEETVDPPITYSVSELTQGAALKGANGVDIGPDGNLYIGSVNGLEIVVMDKENGTISERFGTEMQVNGADDLVFGPDGSLYWTDILVGEVGRKEPDGTITKQFVAPGVNPIAFSDDGRLFVALDFLGDGLYELDPNLTEAPRPIIVATEANPFPLGFFNSFDFGPDGRLYGPLFAAGLVISVDVDRTGDPTSDPFADGSAQVLAGGFVNPAAAKFDPEGMLTVLDQTGEVFKIDIMTGTTTLFTTLDPGLDNMVYDTDGSLYMTNNDEGWVGELLPSGQLRTISPGGLIVPQGLAFLQGADNVDKLFVADQFNVRQLNAVSGERENSYKGYLIPPDPTQPSLVLPMNISADGSNLIVSSWFSAAVQVWNPQTGIIENYPMGAPVDAVRVQQDIAVSDFGLGGVVWASDNASILPIDNATVFAPGGLTTDGETLWVADWGTGIVWQIDFEGKTPMAPVAVASDLVNPEGLALDIDGALIVAETGAARLSRIDLVTGEKTVIAEGLEFSGPGLEGTPPTWFFDSVTVGPSGAIYVTGGGANIIYRITKD